MYVCLWLLAQAKHSRALVRFCLWNYKPVLPLCNMSGNQEKTDDTQTANMDIQSIQATQNASDSNMVAEVGSPPHFCASFAPRSFPAAAKPREV